MSDDEGRSSDARYEELLTALDDLVALLRQYGETGWADWLSRDRELVERGDGYGLEHLLQAYGGMGSLSDLVLHPANGHELTREEIGPVNDRLRDLSSRAYSCASEMKRDIHRSPGF